MKFLSKLFGLMCFILVAKQEVSCVENPTAASEFHQTKKGDWFTRIRGLYVLPVDSSDSVSTIPNSGVSVHSSWTGEFDFGYMFTKNLGSELILGTCRHTLVGKGSLEGVQIGKAWLLPPTLTLQWRFIPERKVQPYVGVGVNWTLFYSVSSALKDTKLQLEHSWGPALQAGMDIFFFKDWLVNIDVKYIWMDTNATLTGGVNGKVKVHINPFVFGLGIGRKW